MNVRMVAYSWGSITAVNVSRRLTADRIGKYRLDVDIPVQSLVVLDPIHHGIPRMLRHTHGPVKANVVNFFNYYQTRGGFTNIDLYFPNSNISAGVDGPYGTGFSSLLKADLLQSSAQTSVQRDVTTHPT